MHPINRQYAQSFISELLMPWMIQAFILNDTSKFMSPLLFTVWYLIYSYIQLFRRQINYILITEIPRPSLIILKCPRRNIDMKAFKMRKSAKYILSSNRGCARNVVNPSSVVQFRPAMFYSFHEKQAFAWIVSNVYPDSVEFR